MRRMFSENQIEKMIEEGVEEALTPKEKFITENDLEWDEDNSHFKVSQETINKIKKYKLGYLGIYNVDDDFQFRGIVIPSKLGSLFVGASDLSSSSVAIQIEDETRLLYLYSFDGNEIALEEEERLSFEFETIL